MTLLTHVHVETDRWTCVEWLQTIGRLRVHGDVTSLEVCHDGRTLVLGCADGSVQSYVVDASWTWTTTTTGRRCCLDWPVANQTTGRRPTSGWRRRQRQRHASGTRLYSGVARIWCDGGAQNYMKLNLFVAHIMTLNNTMNEVHIAATELPQLLLSVASSTTEWTTKSDILFLTITLANLDRFL